MKIIDTKDPLRRIVEVYVIYWVNNPSLKRHGQRMHLVIPYDGYNGFLVISEEHCEVVDNSIDEFLIKKDDHGGDMLIHWAAEKGNLVYRLIDPPDAEAVAELHRRISEGRPSS